MSGSVVTGKVPLPAAVPACTPSTNSVRAEPSYVPTTRCHAPVEGKPPVTVPMPEMLHLSVSASSSRRYWLSAAPFWRMRWLPPPQVVELIHAATLICVPGLSEGESGTVTYVLALPSNARALLNRPMVQVVPL